MPTTSEAVRAEALFASSLQASQQPAADEVRHAVASTLRRLGIRGCAAEVAGEYGDHPDAAVTRMTWAVAMVQTAYPPSNTTPRTPHRLALAVRQPRSTKPPSLSTNLGGDLCTSSTVASPSPSPSQVSCHP
jgi:hypothetical protein